MNQALDGIRVIDLTRVLAGPYATMILADLGAEVIKIEIPDTGDDARHFGPFVQNESAYFMSLNRNKKSITLDLKTQKGKELFIELIKKADVIVENFRPGTMEKLGLGYEDLTEHNPEIIYAAVSGFGHTGPYSSRAAYDGVVQAMSGIMSITGQKDGKPTRVGASIGDITAGLFAAIGILSALYCRKTIHRGQKVDVAMLDCQVAILENAIARYVVTGEVPKPLGNRHTSITPFESFETKDGEIVVAAGNDVLFARLCSVLEAKEMAIDEKFLSNRLRTENVDELASRINSIMKKQTTKEWMKKLDEAGIPNGPINTIDKVLKDPQVTARNMVVDVEHPAAGKFKMPGIPIKMSETQGEIRHPSPSLGQHTEEILSDLLGLTEDMITILKKEKVC